MRFCLSRWLKGIRLGTMARFHRQHHSLSRENDNGSEHLFSFFLIYLLISLELRKLQRGGLPPSVRNPKSEWSCSNNLDTLCLIWTKDRLKTFDLAWLFCDLKFPFHWSIRIKVCSIQERVAEQIRADSKTVFLACL